MAIRDCATLRAGGPFSFCSGGECVVSGGEAVRRVGPAGGRLLAEHAVLRGDFAGAQARSMSTESLLTFAQRLSGHIRKEERQLFERMQELMGAEELGELGRRLEDALKDAGQACIVPSAGTRRRAEE